MKHTLGAAQRYYYKLPCVRLFPENKKRLIQAFFKVAGSGFEPATPRVCTACSSQLSYPAALNRQYHTMYFMICQGFFKIFNLFFVLLLYSLSEIVLSDLRFPLSDRFDLRLPLWFLRCLPPLYSLLLLPGLPAKKFLPL